MKRLTINKDPVTKIYTAPQTFANERPRFASEKKPMRKKNKPSMNKNSCEYDYTEKKMTAD